MRPRHTLLAAAAAGGALAAAAALSTGTDARPAPNRQFPLPLADGRTATAIYLPRTATDGWLLCITPDGTLQAWHLTDAAPTPPPAPPPTPTPDPTPTPNPTRPTTLIVVGYAGPHSLAPEISARLPAWRLTYRPLSVAQVQDPSTPPDDLRWIGRTAGRTYPYAFLAADDLPIWAGTLPETADEAIILIERLLAVPPQRHPPCPGGRCPL